MMKQLNVREKRYNWLKALLLIVCLFGSLTQARAAGGLYSWGNIYGPLLPVADLTKVPAGVNLDGIPTDVSIVSLAAGATHILILGSDGRLYSWGANDGGQLGNGTTIDSNTPVTVDTSGALAGKTIVSIAAGIAYSLALSADGQVYSWGRNENGNLGNGTGGDISTDNNSSVPVAVDMSGALAGKTVKAIAAGTTYALALASDGHLYSWGSNNNGQLGNGTTEGSNVPVAVDMTGALAGKTITAFTGGSFHNLVLTADNQLYSWGSNFAGQCGDGTMTQRSTPVAVDMSGVLSGQTITAIVAGSAHSLVLTAAGRVYSWGYNGDGELGTGLTSSSDVPVSVDTTGVLSGKTIVAISSKIFHNLALDSDGVIYSWGSNEYGQLGNGTTTLSRVPVAVYSGGVLSGKTGTKVFVGGNYSLTTATGGDMTPPNVAVTSPANGKALGQ